MKHGTSWSFLIWIGRLYSASGMGFLHLPGSLGSADPGCWINTHQLISKALVLPIPGLPGHPAIPVAAYQEVLEASSTTSPNQSPVPTPLPPPPLSSSSSYQPHSPHSSTTFTLPHQALHTLHGSIPRPDTASTSSPTPDPSNRAVASALTQEMHLHSHHGQGLSPEVRVLHQELHLQSSS